MTESRTVNEREKGVIIFLHEQERRRLKADAAMHGWTMQQLILDRLRDIIAGTDREESEADEN